MAKKHQARVAVGSPHNPYSSVWLFWTYKDEFYAAAREGSGFIKLSLHSSGDWRLARVSELDVETAGDRVFARWRPPAETLPGWTRCMDVNVPWTDYEARFPIRYTSKKHLTWLDPPHEDGGWQLFVAMSTPSANEGQQFIGDDFTRLARLPFITGGAAWVFAQRYTASDEERAYIASRHVSVSVKAGASASDFFAAVLEWGEDERPVLTNYVLGPQHLVFS